MDRIAMADARQILLSQADPGGQPRRWFAAVLVGAALWMGAMPLPQLRAAELRESEVPQPLRSWVPWVLQDHETIACPAAYNDGDRHECVWPARLTLAVGAQGGRFSLDVEIFRSDELVVLPGQPEAWPRGVRANGRAVPMTESGGRPALRLPAGHFVIEGEFAWRELPQGIALPPNTGLVDARRDGKPLGWPDAGGQLWLREAAGAAAEADTLSVRAYRRIDDEIPVRLTTRLELTASGRPREARLSAALLPGFVALGVVSPLPARLQPDGTLRVQLRAGTWTIDVAGRSRGPVAALAAPAADEVWSFAARNDLRIVTVDAAGGAIGLDPRQAGVPKDWQGLPAFRMPSGSSLKFIDRRRGDPEPEADKLSLDRTLWLDFDGGGFTARDVIRGTISRSWRLDAVPALAVGRVAVGGQEQFITRLPEAGAATGAGIEVRQGNALIDADSRIAFGHALPVTGWQADFDRASIDLRLPPGWRLLHAGGADVVAGSWVAQWTLWDFFFVLLIVAASLRLCGRAAALVLGASLALTWHLPGAPTWLWLVLLTFGALRAALDARAGERGRRFAAWVRFGWRATLAAIVIALLAFAVGELRAAIYPALEATQGQQRGIAQTGFPLAAQVANAPAPVPSAGRIREFQGADELKKEAAAAIQERTRGEERSAAISSTGPSSSAVGLPLRDLARQDPNAKIQTGPGLPDWSWHSYALGWSGPVERVQHVSLWLEPPWLTRAMTLLALVLAAAAIWLHARPRPATTGGDGPASSAPGPSVPAPAGVSGIVAGLAALVALGAAISCVPGNARAATTASTPEAPSLSDWPSDARLEELRQRLRRPAACQPECAQLAQLGVGAHAGSLQLQLELHTGTDAFLPLPGGANWHAGEVRVDARPANLRRDDFTQGLLWVRLPPGVHQVTMTAEVGDAEFVQIALPLLPKLVRTDLAGWSLEGVDARGLATGALTLTRTRAAPHTGQRQDLPEAAPAFVRVVRTLQLDLQWTIDTAITRAGPAPTPLSVRVPLLAGEAVTDTSVRVDGNVAIVTLGAGQNGRFSSSLKVQPRLTLRAADEPNQAETWRLDVAPLWHARFTGIAPTQRQQADRWLPQWQPWPGESLTIDVVRPEGVAGATLTIDRVDLLTRPGLRATDVTATVALRSSQGGNHVIELPQGAELRAVRIDGQPQPIRAEGRRVTLPLAPGSRMATLEWREMRGIESVFHAAHANLGAAAVNLNSAIAVPPDRWVLAVGGPVLGPAVLFWGLACAIAAAAWALGRLRWTPLGFVHWLLLGIGVAQATLVGAVFVAAVLLALQVRARFGARIEGARFNLMQLALATAALIAVLILFDAIRTGLLGTPQMWITGNLSGPYALRWYADRSDGAPPAAWVFSLPLWAYRVLMLGWALWLALAVVRYARWAWTCFSTDRLWGPWRLRTAPAG